MIVKGEGKLGNDETEVERDIKQPSKKKRNQSISEYRRTSIWQSYNCGKCHRWTVTIVLRKSVLFSLIIKIGIISKER